MDVHVDIVTEPTRPVAATAKDVRRVLVEVLAGHDLRPGTIGVAVLSAER